MHIVRPLRIPYSLRSWIEMITSAAGGVFLNVRLVPRAAQAGVAGTRDGALLVRVHAPPVEGAANIELIQVLAEALGVPKRQVTIVAGERGRFKRVKVEGITADRAAERLKPWST